MTMNDLDFLLIPILCYSESFIEMFSEMRARGDNLPKLTMLILQILIYQFSQKR